MNNFGYKGRITAPRIANIGAKLKHAANMLDLSLDYFDEDKGFFKSTVLFRVTGSEKNVHTFTRWFDSI